jgi:transposase-like protein
MAAAAHSLRVVEQALCNWVNAHRAGTLKGAGSKPPVTAEKMEISRLRAELAPMVRATTKAIPPASILRTVFSAAARRLAFCNILREFMHEHHKLQRRELTGQECNLAP